jgi:uncharacterized protein Usg
MSGHPSLLQFFLWQKLDLALEYPVLTKFLDFWEAELDGKIHSVRVAHKGLVSPAALRMATEAGRLH